MPFVHRDVDGNILAVYDDKLEGSEEISADDPALKAFVQKNIPSMGNMINDEWLQSDLALARVMEDLIDILIDKKVILFTDFPEGAQKKLRERRGARKQVTYVEDLFGTGEDENFGGGGGGSGIF